MGKSENATFGHGLRMKPRGVLFHAAEGVTDDKCRVFLRRVESLEHIHVGHRIDAKATGVRNLTAIDEITLREGFVPP